MSIKPLDALARSHERAAARPRHSTWFEEEEQDDEEVTGQMAVVGALAHPPVVVSPEAPLSLVHAALHAGAHAVIVVDGARFVGAVTAASLLACVGNAARDAVAPAIKLSAATAVSRAAVCFSECEIAAIVDDRDTVVGVITAHDVLRALI